jgi:RHS repeat-associated protein
VVDLVDGAGNVLNHFVYDSFGNRTATTAADFRFGYTGRELDGESGLYYYRARYYDPSLGRFISEDPIGFSAGDTNLYRYVSNSPTNFTDPSGLLISGWAEDALYAADSFFAGFADATTFGVSSKIRELRYGSLATDNHQGGWFAAGSVVGGIAGFALGYGAEAQAAKLSAAFVKGVRTYDAIGTGLGFVESARNFADGTASAWDLLNFAPAAGFVTKNGRKIGGSLMRAGDNAADAAWRGFDRLSGNEMQPRLILANGGGAASATSRIDDIPHYPSFMAMDAGDIGKSRIVKVVGKDGNTKFEAPPLVNRDPVIPEGLMRGKIDFPTEAGFAQHHVISVKVAQKSEVMRIAAEKYGYNINRNNNIINLPTDKKLSVEHRLPMHTGDHLDSYYDAVRVELNKLENAYKEGRIKESKLVQTIGKIENKLKNRIQNRELQLQDGYPWFQSK